MQTSPVTIFSFFRTHEQAALDANILATADDHSYIMTLVQEELSAVQKQIDSKERVKIVDYDSNSSDDDSSEEESSESSSSDDESSSDSDSSTDDRYKTILLLINCVFCPFIC